MAPQMAQADSKLDHHQVISASFNDHIIGEGFDGTRVPPG